jgi:hypothetical protein
MASIKTMLRRLFFLATLLAAVSAPAGTKVSRDSGMTARQIEDLGEIVEPDEDLAGRTRASVAIRNEFTSNATLSGNHGNNDYIFLPTLEAGYTLPLSPAWSLDFAAKVEFGLYANHDERSFAGYSVKTTLDYHPFANGPRFYAAIEPHRYDSFDTGDRLTQGIAFTTGTDYGYAFNAGRSLLFTGYSYTGTVADPTIDTRHAHRVVIGLAHQFRQDLTAQLFYAWQYSDFINYDRHDSKHVIGLNLIYQLSQSWFATLTGAWVDNDSDVNPATFQSASGAIGVQYQF